MKSSAISAAFLFVLSAHCAAVTATSTGNSSAGTTAADLDTLQRLNTILSPGYATAQCARKLTFGGSCECNYREPESGRDADIKYDMHLHGQRRVCIDKGYLQPGGPCRVLSVQASRYNGRPSGLGQQLGEFGCASDALKQMYTDDATDVGRFSLRREMKQMAVSHLDLLDVSVPGKDHEVLSDLLRAKPKVSAQQVALTVVLDENDIVGDGASSFTVDVARGYLKLLTQLEAVGYRMLSFKPHSRCVEEVQKMHNICLPILSNTVWIK